MDIMITIDKPKPYLGRDVAIQKEFQVDGIFQSMYAANAWLRGNNYSYGSLDHPNPVAIVKGEYAFTQKWHNFSNADKKAVDGVITGDMRGGIVTIRIFGE